MVIKSCKNCALNRHCNRIDQDGYSSDCNWKPGVLDFCKTLSLDEISEKAFSIYFDRDLIIKLPHEIVRKLQRVRIIDADSKEEIKTKTFTSTDDGFLVVKEPINEIDYDDSYLDNAEVDPDYKRIENLIDARGNIARTLGI